jgi:hypothetical protein
MTLFCHRVEADFCGETILGHSNIRVGTKRPIGITVGIVRIKNPVAVYDIFIEVDSVGTSFETKCISSIFGGIP